MNLRIQRVATDAAEMDLLIGLITAGAIAFLRALALFGILAAAGPTDFLFLFQHAVAFVLVLALTYGIYHRRPAAAIGLLVVWGLGYFYSWYFMGRLLPPLGLIGLLIWYGLYRGLRGTRFLASRRLAAANAERSPTSTDSSAHVPSP